MERTGTRSSLKLPTLLTAEELAESLVLFRRQLTEKITIAMIRTKAASRANIAANAEDLANAICERLAARETGRVEGYK